MMRLICSHFPDNDLKNKGLDGFDRAGNTAAVMEQHGYSENIEQDHNGGENDCAQSFGTEGVGNYGQPDKCAVAAKRPLNE